MAGEQSLAWQTGTRGQYDLWTPAIEGELKIEGSIIYFKIEYPINFLKKVFNVSLQELKSEGEVLLALNLMHAKKIDERYGSKYDRRIQIFFEPHGDFLNKRTKHLEFNILSPDKNVLKSIYPKLVDAKMQDYLDKEVGYLKIIEK